MTSTELASNEHVVGTPADFPLDSHKVVKVRHLELGIFNVDGELYALPNICPHQFGPLSKGPVTGMMVCNARTDWRFNWIREGEIVVCPWHGLEFEISTGRALALDRYSVRVFPVSVVDDDVIVTLKPVRYVAKEGELRPTAVGVDANTKAI